MRAAAAAAALWLAAAVGCSARLDWREVRLPAERCAVLLPDRPQQATRTVALPSGPVTMTMTSTGVGRTLFAVGVAQLPASALEPAALEATVAWFRDGLLRNFGARLTSVQPVALRTPPGRTLRSAQAVAAAAEAGADGRRAALAARFFVVDDRLYQVVAVGAEQELPQLALDTFFDSFRLTE